MSSHLEFVKEEMGRSNLLNQLISRVPSPSTNTVVITPTNDNINSNNSGINNINNNTPSLRGSVRNS